MLTLSEQPAQPFEGVRDNVFEVQGNGFPIAYTGPGRPGLPQRNTPHEATSQLHPVAPYWTGANTADAETA